MLCDSTTLTIEPPLLSTIDPSSIAKLVETKDLRWLSEQGGVEGLVSALETHAENGIQGNSTDINNRCRVFGSNFYGEDKPAKKFHYFGLEALKHPMIVILLVCAVLSLCFGIKEHGLREGWYEGVTKLVAILITVTVSAVSNFWPHRLCHKLSEASNHIPQVDVVRSSQWLRISVPNIVVGDIVFLKPGDQVLADGLFLSGCSLQVAKLRMDGQTERVEVVGHNNPFLCCGGEVVGGYARMLVTAVGKNRWTPKIDLEGAMLNKSQHLTSVIGKFGHAMAFLILLVKLARLFSWKGEAEAPIVDVLKALVGIVATPAMVAATSAPEGLLLAVKITLAYSMKRMLNDDNVVLRRPSLCDAIGSVTTICTNITGSLTINYDEVNKFWLGLSYIEQVPANLIAPDVIELLHQGIGLNATRPPSGSFFDSPQNPTEKAIFNWAIRQMGVDIDSLKRSCTILEIEPFSSENRQSRVLICKNGDNMIHEHRKGDPEIIIPLCSHYYETTGTVKFINQYERVLLDQILEDMSKNGLMCIAFAHRKTSIRDCHPGQQMILLGLVGLKNSLRYGVEAVVEDCQRVGLNIRIITGNNILIARAIAINCGIIGVNDHPGEVIEGVDFRNYTKEERMEKVLNICVMARATPFDKFLMVQCLKQKGHVVGVIGCGIGDVQALREADVGLCLGTQGANIAKAYSDIVIQHENLASVISILRWGRGIFEIVQIYTQFLLTASFVALVTDFVMAISTGNTDAVALLSVGKVPYPTFQLMWVKLVMDTLVALAVIIKEPTEELVNRPPRGRNEPLMTNIMIRNIMVQGLYQIAILLTIYFKGKSIFNVDSNAKSTLILNTYVLCQIFIIFNAEKNVFQDIRKRKVFWGIIMIILILQVFIVEVLNRFADTAKLDWGQWGTSIALAAISWPITWVVKCISELEKPFFSNSNWQKIDV